MQEISAENLFGTTTSTVTATTTPTTTVLADHKRMNGGGGSHHHAHVKCVADSSSLSYPLHADNKHVKLETDSPPLIIKLEDSTDLFTTWPSCGQDEFVGLNLLPHAEDTLIATTTLIGNEKNDFIIPITSGNCVPSPLYQTSQQSHTPLAKQTATVRVRKPNRVRRKSEIKLRFHHQALPAEYLDHYEASQNNLAKRKAAAANAANAGGSGGVRGDTANAVAAAAAATTTNDESVRNWLAKIAAIETECVPNQELFTAAAAAATRMSPPSGKIVHANSSHGVATLAVSAPSRIVNYSDLPYMGEMTLENSKPRRGRKPKKADICHLIYKNYGTILPGTPRDIVDDEMRVDMDATELRQLAAAETAGRMRAGKMTATVAARGHHVVETPLNLCVRDHGDTSLLVFSSSGSSKSSSSGGAGGGRDEDHNDDCPTAIVTDAMPAVSSSSSSSAAHRRLAANLKMSLPNFEEALLEKTLATAKLTDSASPTHWPANHLYFNPMPFSNGQKVEEKLASATVSAATVAKVAIKSVCTTPTSPSSSSTAATCTTATTTPTSELGSTPAISTSAPPAYPPPGPTTKRKRSAIFIPPMPSESPNPATEVQICKFKFSGGPKPSLQEKKMLSVDKGGNFRYYSGTGDKSMRGYEFFPRESLQQSGMMSGSSAGAFLSTPGERILSGDMMGNEIMPLTSASTVGSAMSSERQSKQASVIVDPFHQLRNHTNGMANEGGSNSCATSAALSCSSTTAAAATSNGSIVGTDRRKKKSRRSLQREKLEQTFKEKGFLIQTQQLESAEGATYCKFRQLRKFTRYLFRSWKDYLPGELQQQQQHQQQHQHQPPQLPQLSIPSRSSTNGQTTSGNHAKNLLQPTALMADDELKVEFCPTVAMN